MANFRIPHDQKFGTVTANVVKAPKIFTDEIDPLTPGGTVVVNGALSSRKIFTEATLTGTQTISNNITTPISFTSAVNHSDIMWVITSPTVFTILTPGPYHVESTMTFVSNNVGVRAILLHHVRGITTTNFGHLSAVPVTGEAHRLHVDGQIDCIAGDTILVNVFQTSGGDLNIDSTTGLCRGTILRIP